MAQADQTRKQQDEQDTTALLANQAKANRRLRVFAYFTLMIVVVGVVVTVVLGVINTVGLSDEQQNSKAARKDNHTLLVRSADGSTKAVALFNQALTVLHEVGQTNAAAIRQAELNIIEFLEANGFKPPTASPSK